MYSIGLWKITGDEVVKGLEIDPRDVSPDGVPGFWEAQEEATREGITSKQLQGYSFLRKELKNIRLG